MKKFLLSIVVLATTIMPAMAKWVKCDIKDLTATDVVVIVDQTSACAMPNDNGTSKAPQFTAITFNSDKSELTGEIADNLKWNIVIGSTSNTYSIYPNGTTETWLYCTNSNNGVRVGTNANNKFFSWTEGYLKNINLGRYMGVYNKQDWRCYTKTTGSNIENTVTAFYKYVEGESVITQVATPEITPNGGAITKDTEITIACATEGASIYYTLDGSVPTAESTEYKGAFTLNESCTVSAIAVAEGLDNSNSVTAVFTILKEGTLYYESFDQCTGTGGNDNQWSGSIATSGIKCDNENNTSIKGYGADKSAKFGSSGEKGSFTTPELTELGNVDGGYAIVSFKAAPWNEESSSIEVSIDGGGTVVSSAIELTPKQWNNCTFSIAGGSATTKITISATQNRFFLDEVMVIASNDTVVAIEEVGVDANAPVEYYNLQGVKVARPENGIFIKKQGSKTTKVVL